MVNRFEDRPFGHDRSMRRLHLKSIRGSEEGYGALVEPMSVQMGMKLSVCELIED